MLLSALIALAVTSLFFILVFALGRALHNFGVVDVAWSLGFAPLAAVISFIGPGDLTRRLLLAGLMGIWSLRLGLHLWRRVAAHHPREDGRYAQLRREWGAKTNPRMFGFFQLQALLLWLLTLPCWLVAWNDATGLRPLEVAASILWLVAVAGEGLADHQLAVFREKPANSGRVCARGLWSWSRHPNYFFEWLVWVAFALFALASPLGWIALVCPALMFFFLTRVTGVVYTEAQSLRSKGDAYRAYQQRTSAFFLRPPRGVPEPRST